MSQAIDEWIHAVVKAKNEQMEADVRSVWDGTYPPRQDIEVIYQNPGAYRGVRVDGQMVIDHHPDWPMEGVS